MDVLVLIRQQRFSDFHSAQHSVTILAPNHCRKTNASCNAVHVTHATNNQSSTLSCDFWNHNISWTWTFVMDLVSFVGQTNCLLCDLRTLKAEPEVFVYFFIRIHSDIGLDHYFDTNIFRYLFVLFFCYKYIWIFVHIKNFTFATPGYPILWAAGPIAVSTISNLHTRKTKTKKEKKKEEKKERRKTLPEAQRTQKLTPWLGLNLATTWHLLHLLKIWPPDGATCNS